MSQPPHNYELSVMEDLDPEPPTRARSVRAREVVLGVLLLLGVLGWAGWQWWHGESLRNNYELGRQAVIEQRWEEAKGYFEDAEGYRDAATRAEDAEKKIEERNKQYELASIHAEAGEWVVALQTAREAAAIQPEYKDLHALVTEAERHVYRDALRGTVAKRLGDDPGLYYRDADSWVRLQDSDRWSDVQSYGQDGTFLYDVPGPGWVPQPTPTTRGVEGQPPAQEPLSPQLADRQLVAASFQGDAGPSFHKLSFDPTWFSYYIVSRAGVWGVRQPFDGDARPNTVPGLLLDAWFNRSEIVYQAHASSLTSTISIAPNMGIVDFGAQGKHVLLAELLLPEFDPQGSGVSGVRLYVAEPDGSQRRLIYTTTGSIKTARLSPDERYVLVLTIEHLEGSRGKMAAVLLDLESAVEPRTLVEADAMVRRTSTTMLVDDSSGLSATFLRRGHFANKVLVTIRDSRLGTEVKLIDPAHPDWSRTIASVRGEENVHTPVYMPVYEQANGNSVVIHTVASENTFITGRPITGSLSIAQFDPALAQWTYVPVRVTSYNEAVLSPERKSDQGRDFTRFMVVEERLVYGAFFFNPQEFTIVFYSVPLADLDKKEPALTEVFRTTQSPDNPSPSKSWIAGPNMFVYTNERHELHVRTYDGAIDLVLERGVEFVRSDTVFSY